jgi:hypothetical protein
MKWALNSNARTLAAQQRLQCALAGFNRLATQIPSVVELDAPTPLMPVDPPTPKSASEKLCQEGTQRRAAEQHRPVEGCHPKQPTFAQNATKHRDVPRCQTFMA